MSRLARFLQLEGGWLVPILLMVLIILPVFSMNDAKWVDRTQELLPIALLGGIIGILFAKSRINRFLAVPLMFALGLGILYVVLGQVLPPMRTISSQLAELPNWYSRYLNGQYVELNPLWTLGQEIHSRNDLMAGRLWQWITVGTEGGYSSDNFVFFFLLALLTCGVAIYTAWALYRYHNALVAVLPVGLLLFINSFLSARGTTWLIIFVVTALILLMAAHLASLQHKWKKKDIDYSAELNFDLTFFAVQVSAVLAVLALVMPTLRANPVASTWWIYASRPWGEVETTFNRMFAGVNNPNPDLGTGSKGALVLGGSFEPPESSPVYMYVKTNEYVMPPDEAERTGEPGLGPPAHYWRGETWDYYTGRGWDHSNKAAVDRTADQPTINYNIQGAQILRQEVEIVSPRADIMFGANQIVTPTQPYRYLGIGPEDFATLYLKRAPLSAATYVISSEVPTWGQPTCAAPRPTTQNGCRPTILSYPRTCRSA